MGEQASQILCAHVRERVVCVVGMRVGRCCIAHEQVATGGHIDQRLVQVPAAGHDLFKRRAAHEGGVVARTPQGLPDGAAKQHHVVGGGESVGGVEHRFDLTGAEFDFERL